MGSNNCFSVITRIIGIILLFPFALVGYILAWSTIAAIGVIIFVGFPCAAIFLDAIRWVATNYNEPEPKPEYLANRLKKAATIIINIFEIMADLKKTPVTAVPVPTLSEPLNLV